MTKKKDPKNLKKRGAKDLYNPLYPKMLLNYFSPPYYLIKDITITKPDGTQIDKTELEPLPPRFLSGFAAEIKLSLVSYRKVFLRWGENYPEFGDALKTIKELQAEQFQTNGSMNLYSPAFSIFTLKNIAGWRDVQDVNHGGKILTANVDLTGKPMEELIDFFRGAVSKGITG